MIVLGNGKTSLLFVNSSPLDNLSLYPQHHNVLFDIPLFHFIAIVSSIKSPLFSHSHPHADTHCSRRKRPNHKEGIRCVKTLHTNRQSMHLHVCLALECRMRGNVGSVGESK